ncbi:sugar 3,4-ketoisomerase [Mucilaginibacter sp. E4BP6]|jgi:dTDP-4-dehydrorhamnose 3,5-epimerase-like enzyme|uniref:sugar 3,4-ketoisomerase n=1 Tax=Mucilaginibacter sp. E4BP6 TaxID=2723089 RepID=UPI0015C835F4|nr:FdtA/QdtA family cupin domain-containing protein [Mucilaginibacter sp. E4BP6]NYE67474.1 dTDP-4-dehydrorhamnose 3,5-epimerase-like enzyme [Mucilaginibacter sp. E4BP6]
MAYFIELKTHTDDRGSLNSIDRVLPFDIKRIYYIYNVNEALNRGGHRHFETIEGLICMNGTFTVLIDNGREKKEYYLSDPSKILIMEIGDWHVMYDLSPDAVLMGIASTNYDPKDYAYEPLSVS